MFLVLKDNQSVVILKIVGCGHCSGRFEQHPIRPQPLFQCINVLHTRIKAPHQIAEAKWWGRERTCEGEQSDSRHHDTRALVSLKEQLLVHGPVELRRDATLLRELVLELPPLAVEPLDELGQSPPGGHAQDVAVAVALDTLDLDLTVRGSDGVNACLFVVLELTRDELVHLIRNLTLALDHDHGVGVRFPELGLVLDELRSPDRIRPAVELLAQQIHGLSAVGSPVGQLGVATPGETAVREDVHSAVRFELGVGPELPDITDHRDDARGNRPAQALDWGEQALEDLKLLGGLLELRVALLLLGLDRHVDGVVRAHGLVGELDLTLGIATIRIAENPPHEVGAEPLVGRYPGLHRLDAGLVGLTLGDEIAVTRIKLVELGRHGLEELGDEFVVGIALVFYVVRPPLTKLEARKVEGRSADLFDTARPGVGQPVARTRKDEADHVARREAVELGRDLHSHEGRLLLGLNLGRVPNRDILTVIHLAPLDLVRRDRADVLVVRDRAEFHGVAPHDEVQLVGLGLELEHAILAVLADADLGRLALRHLTFLDDHFHAMRHTDEPCHSDTSFRPFWPRPLWALCIRPLALCRRTIFLKSEGVNSDSFVYNSTFFVHHPLFKTQIFYVTKRGPHQIAEAKWWGDKHQGHCHLRRI